MLGDSKISRNMVLFGAGGLGRKLLQGIRAEGIEPLAFCDNNQDLWGRSVEGVPVLSPANAGIEFGATALFIVCVWHPSRTSVRRYVQQLRELGCLSVIAFTEVFQRFPETFLPSYFLQKPCAMETFRRDIDTARALFNGPDREEYDRQVRLRFAGDILNLTEPVPGMQYFPEDLISLSDREVFVDCGAYNGDTLQDFVLASRGRFDKFIAFEPDPNNFQELQLKINDSRITAHPFAVGDQTETLPFTASGAMDARVASEGTSLVQCVRLDELLADEQPTYIKMDIEGAEPKALLGAEKTIKRCRPKLAVCVYHETEHLWTIPVLMKELQPQANFYLRPHMADGWDLVCYSIPAASEQCT